MKSLYPNVSETFLNMVARSVRKKHNQERHGQLEIISNKICLFSCAVVAFLNVY